MKMNLFILSCFVGFLTQTIYAQTQQTEPLHDAIVKINWRYLDLDVIDDKSILSGDIHTFLNEKGEGFLKEKNINPFIGLKVIKIFSFLSTTDTISIGRLGNRVRIPTFWSVFKIELNYETEVFQYCRDLYKLTPFISYAHPNYSGSFDGVPNDPLFSTNQYAFNNAPGLIDYVHLDSAWNIETGKPFVKVGIFDTGIDTTHPDLDVLTGRGYYNPDPGPFSEWEVDSNGHGTRVAGIVGAKRNNGVGVAGIAGGDGSDSSGVSLIAFNVLDDSDQGSLPFADAVSVAIVDGARSVGGYHDWTNGVGFSTYPQEHHYNQGFGILLANHSYTFVVADPLKNEWNSGTGDSEVIQTGKCDLCIEAYLFSYESNVINVGSRGNYREESTSHYGSPYDWPSRMQDHMYISVGATAFNGEVLSITNNSSTEGLGSKLAGNVDLVAPGTDSLLYTTTSSNDQYAGIYGPFNGTSGAAPHVTGAVALLLSYYNKPCYSNYNLAQEDVEYLLQISATDVQGAGYDDSTGWGRLNVRALLDSLKRPDYQIIHPTDNPINYTIVLEDTIEVYGKELQSYGPYSNEDLVQIEEAPGSTFGKKYEVERFKVTATYDFSSYLSQFTTELLNVWLRKNTSSFSVFMEDTLFIGNPPGGDNVKKFKLEHDCEIVSVNGNMVTFTGYLYHFIFNIPDAIQLNVWYPEDTSHFHFDYSVYLKDTITPLNFDFPCDSTNMMVDTAATIQDLNFSFTIYPNPTTNYFHIESSKLYSQIIIYDLTGKLIYKKEYYNSIAKQNININYLPKGIYFVNIITDIGDTQTQKIIKQ